MKTVYACLVSALLLAGCNQAAVAESRPHSASESLRIKMAPVVDHKVASSGSRLDVQSTVAEPMVMPTLAPVADATVPETDVLDSIESHLSDPSMGVLTPEAADNEPVY